MSAVPACAHSWRGPSLRRTKAGALGYGRHKPPRHSGEKGSPHTWMQLWAPSCFRGWLKASEAGEAEARFQQTAVCSPLGAWMGLAAPVPPPWHCRSHHHHSHTHRSFSILHPLNIFQKSGGDQKSMPEGHGHFEPNPVRVSWLGKGLQKHPPTPV